MLYSRSFFARFFVHCLSAFFVAALCLFTNRIAAQEVFPGTEPITWEGDITSKMVSGLDDFLVKKTEHSRMERANQWRFSSQPQGTSDGQPSRQKQLDEHRKRLAQVLGVRDERVKVTALRLTTNTSRSALVAENDSYQVFSVSWPVIRDVRGEGLLLVPKKSPVANVIAIPDASHTPEMLAGIQEGVSLEAQYARKLAEAGYQVVVPRLLSRRIESRNRRAALTDREYVYRITFEFGRHPIGYELQSVFAVADWFASSSPESRPMGVIGWGEGGLLALHAGAMDQRFATVGVSGFFGDRRAMWSEPVDRNLFGYLKDFGDAEVASLIAPRSLIIESAAAPKFEIAPGQAAAPGKLHSPTAAEVRAEVVRAESLYSDTEATDWVHVHTPSASGSFWQSPAMEDFTLALTGVKAAWSGESLPKQKEPLPDFELIRKRQLHEMENESTWLLQESPFVRKEFWKKADLSSVGNFQETTKWYREHLRNEIIGVFADDRLAPKPRTRRIYERDTWTGYEVVLDVFPDVFAYGILLWPKGIGKDEKRPVVVCQHGLEGRPTDTIVGDHRAYHDFAAKLAEQGFIVFAPQNCYIFKDRFRTLQRKANPLKKTLFSLMVPQHQQITDWLASLPQVDSDRIGFYGLSYGGKSAMRIPPLVDRYCLSICSADFNEWIWKNVSTRDRYSYVWTGEYEIFEFDLGSTYNYAELAALIAPRPFMVERGHFDGVAPDETVAYEFAKVRRLYQAQLGIGDRCEIEWFVGPHTINGKGTFAFLRKHLNWPPAKNSQ